MSWTNCRDWDWPIFHSLLDISRSRAIPRKEHGYRELSAISDVLLKKKTNSFNNGWKKLIVSVVLFYKKCLPSKSSISFSTGGGFTRQQWGMKVVTRVQANRSTWKNIWLTCLLQQYNFEHFNFESWLNYRWLISRVHILAIFEPCKLAFTFLV